MADWEAFLARVPPQLHRAWSQRVQSMVVDGSPKWEVFRVVDVPAAGGAAAAPSTPRAAVAPPAAAAAAATNPWGFTGDSGSGGRARAGDSAGSGSGAGSAKIVFADKIPSEDAALWEKAQRELAAGSGGNGLEFAIGSMLGGGSGGGVKISISGSGSTEAEAGDGGEGSQEAGDDDEDVPRDWKGDPIKWSPGDKVPFKFL